jgi:hypothetical protein
MTSTWQPCQSRNDRCVGEGRGAGSAAGWGVKQEGSWYTWDLQGTHVVACIMPHVGCHVQATSGHWRQLSDLGQPLDLNLFHCVAF